VLQILQASSGVPGLPLQWVLSATSSKEEGMKLPVDTSSIAFLCALEPQPDLDFETRRPRADENGEPLYVVQLIALAEGAAEILAVKVPGLPSGIRQGHPVKVTGWSPSPGP
jgi:hypothetical protein